MLDVSHLPIWLQPLFCDKFFNPCLIHPEEKMNNLCLDCGKAICPHCFEEHFSHKTLQIRRYMYKDVVRVSEAVKVMDFGRVQTYTNNGEKVVFLKPMPHKGSRTYKCRCCNVCGKGIHDSFYYCSLACKLEFMQLNGELITCPEPGEGDMLIPASVLELSGSGTAEICSEVVVEAETFSDAKVVRRNGSGLPSCRPVSPPSLISRRKGTPFRSPLY